MSELFTSALAELNYQPVGGSFDVVHNPSGTVKPHWRYVLESLRDLGADALSDRQLKAHRILRDDGATYHIYDSGSQPDKTWQLDLIPSLIDSDSWSKIEAGLLERAELFNLILKDIYGPRNLIRHGVIPPEMIFGHPGFLRACHGISLPGEHDLIMHSADIMLDASGQPCILADRTQSPSGAGYALENRTVMSRVLPSMFRDSHVHRLAGFFHRLRTKLTSLSPNQDQPRIVLLTPGAHNETYFEHAYLANYLGLHLVQSGDLVVRNGYVWMKSLSGLSRVDVIWRRVDDWFCDPVELKGDSQLGVANLLEVARSGRVVIANPLGSGILESPCLLRYLPEISKALLGREPRLNTVQTYWCGDSQDRAYVLANLNQLIIKQTYYPTGHGCVFGPSLSATQLHELAEKIKANPSLYVAQPELGAMQLPAIIDGGLAPRPSLLRTFAVASETSYTMMPGGLTRFSTDASSFVIASQAGSQSKDTWVLASEPERASPTIDLAPSAVRQADLISLPSRVVENLFWMGRYAERAESALRFLRAVFVMLNADEDLSLRSRTILLRTVTELTATNPGFVEADEEQLLQPEAELIRVLTDVQLPGSVCFNINAMLNSADESKELLSSDMIRIINDIRDALADLPSSLSDSLSAPDEALNPLVTALMALSGLTQESMIRGTGWRFIEIGRRLERVIQSSRLIHGLIVPEVAEEDQNTLIEALLMSQEVLTSYRRFYGARMGVQSSLDLVMLDISNPRSLLFQLDKLNRHLQALSANHQEGRHELPPAQRAALEAQSLIKLSVLTQLSAREEGKRVVLAQNMSRLTKLLNSISNFITDKYFVHRESSQQLVRSVWENRS